MPDLCVEKTDSSGEFQNLVVTSRLVQRSILENASLLESELVVSQCTAQWSYSVNRKSCGQAIVIK